jgi:hypothetical protein
MRAEHRTESSRWNSRWPLRTIEAAELGRPRARLRNPIMAGWLEGITQPLYDIYRVAAATALPKVICFSVPIGQQYNQGGVAAFAKTLLHTNLVQAGVLAAPNKHIVRAISCLVTGLPGVQNLVNPLDLNAFLNSVLFDFQVNSKSYCTQLPARFPAGGGPQITGTTITVGALFGVNGWPDTRNTYALAYGGVPIEQQQNFSVVLDPTQEAIAAYATAAAAAGAGNLEVPGNGLSVWVYLDGTLYRAVQ